MSRNAAYQQAIIPIQKSSPPDIISEKAYPGSRDNFQKAGFASLPKVFQGIDARKMIGLRHMLLNACIGKMQDVAFKMMHTAIDIGDKLVVRICAAPKGMSFAKKAQFAVGIPATVINPLSTIIGQAVHGKNLGGGSFFKFPDAMG